MVSLAALWLPILIAAVTMFILSFISWMILPHHKSEWTVPPHEDDMLAFLRDKGYKAGQYMLPWCGDPSELKDPEKKARYEAGPHALLVVKPGPPNMGKNLTATFILFAVISVLVAYVTGLARPVGADFMSVFKVAATAGILGYATGPILHHIWMSNTKKTVLDTIDCIVYGVVTGVIFAAMWPGLPAA